jgi:hypothetical protein
MVGILGLTHLTDQLAGAVLGEYVEQAAPIDEGELLNRCGRAVGQQGCAPDSIWSAQRCRTGHCLVDCRGVRGGDPVALGGVRQLLPAPDRVPDPRRVLVAVEIVLAGQGYLAERGNGGLEPVVGDDLDFIAVENERTVGQDQVIDVVASVLE